MEIRMEQSWKTALQSEFEQPYFQSLISFVRKEYLENPQQIFPKGNAIFRALDACPFHAVKVVILGQDPYPTRGHAHGLCFSVEPTVRPLPKSLTNIYKELAEDLNAGIPPNGNLINWANQGVLLLNTVLTVREGMPDSHAGKGWENFTDAVLKKVNSDLKQVVFILWGAKAQAKLPFIDAERHFVICAPHPSPLSAHRGFFGSRPFSRTNNYLIQQGRSPIDWIHSISD
jgi:uracil-DNA glycosylase